MHIPGRRGNARSASRHAGHQVAGPRPIGRRLAATFRGPVLWLTVCGGLLVAAIFAGTIMMVGEFRERALANSERELENTVLLLTRHFDQQFEDSDTIARRRDRADAHFRDRFAGDVPGPDVGRSTRTRSCGPRPASLSYLGDISIFDSDRRS